MLQLTPKPGLDCCRLLRGTFRQFQLSHTQLDHGQSKFPTHVKILEQAPFQPCVHFSVHRGFIATVERGQRRPATFLPPFRDFPLMLSKEFFDILERQGVPINLSGHFLVQEINQLNLRTMRVRVNCDKALLP